MMEFVFLASASHVTGSNLQATNIQTAREYSDQCDGDMARHGLRKWSRMKSYGCLGHRELLDETERTTWGDQLKLIG
jgi:hypothetical protein